MTGRQAELAAIVGPGALLTAPLDLIASGFDVTFFDNTPPLVVLPRTVARSRRSITSPRRVRSR